MKLKDEFIKYPKEDVYEMYLRIVYDFKYYDNISRNKMLDEIIKEYKQEGYLYCMCTSRELNFLNYIKNHKITKEALEKYDWEIHELNNKCIFSLVTLEVFEEQKENVEEALKIFKEKGNKAINEELLIFMISAIKINANMFTKALQGMISSMFKIDENMFSAFLGHPLFHYYCEFSYIDFHGNEEEVISYRDYYDILELEEFDERRKEYGLGGTKEINYQDYFDIFYYGFNIRNPKVKKMYDAIKKLTLGNFIFKRIDEARVLYDKSVLNYIIEDEATLKLVEDAFDEMPSAVMNGFTPRERNEMIYKKLDLKKEIESSTQVNAHISKNAKELFYKLYFTLLEYVNDKYKINSKIEKIYRQIKLDINELKDIDEYIWEHREVIDEFIKDNKYDFNDEELEKVKEFKNGIRKEFVVICYEREYTQMLSIEEGKLYMVKGLTSNIDEIISRNDLPTMITTTLLMFEGNIIYNSYFNILPMEISGDFLEMLLKDYQKAMKYYHL